MRVVVTFAEYTAARTAGQFEGKTQEEALMCMFEERGIVIDDDGQPRRPASILTDKKNERFVLTQGS